MDISFPNRWIGRAGPILWPPRSPDLNPCDFFVWGHMKQLVYVSPVNTIEELQLQVQNAAQEIPQNRGILDLVRLSWARRAEKFALQTVAGILSNFLDVLFYFYSQLQSFYFVV
jgi:hypothetical protein